MQAQAESQSASTASSPAFAPGGTGQTFSGNSTENIGTIHISQGSELHWSCPSCTSSNFQVGNNVNDSSSIAVNSLNQTSGQTYVDPGTYHDVLINTEGSSWTIVINPG
jgi:hypothetical protein